MSVKDREIVFTSHAEEKLSRLTGIGVTKEKVIDVVLNPDRVFPGYYGRKMAQSPLSDTLVLRVVYEEKDNKVVVVTVYPGERERYG